MRKYTIGWMPFEKVDITDPCYNKGEYGRMDDVAVKHGKYKCIIWKHTDKIVSDGKEIKAELVGIIGIYLDGNIPSQKNMTEIGSIDVDAGLAGFFVNKPDYTDEDRPDYTDEEWGSFCDSLDIENKKAWLRDIGFFSTSGYGDRGYPVMASKNESGEIVALEIRFM